VVKLINIQDANSFYAGGVNILFADSRVRLLFKSIDIGAFVAMCTSGWWSNCRWRLVVIAYSRCSQSGNEKLPNPLQQRFRQLI
jgi:prepilin-type processing-associated H-X9-DG protein